LRFRLTLDESRDHDQQVEAEGLTFVLDPFASAFVESLIVDYDAYEDSFVVLNEAGPQSSC
jgi:Fe-S cluster assembly iron-binding protein IscA